MLVCFVISLATGHYLTPLSSISVIIVIGSCFKTQFAADFMRTNFASDLGKHLFLNFLENKRFFRLGIFLAQTNWFPFKSRRRPTLRKFSDIQIYYFRYEDKALRKLKASTLTDSNELLCKSCRAYSHFDHTSLTADFTVTHISLTTSSSRCFS